MTNLAIGLCFGMAAGIAVFVMWRMAEKLRRDMQSRADENEARDRSDRLS